MKFEERRELQRLEKEFGEGRLEPAEKRARQLILRGRGNLFVWNTLGIILAKTGRTAEALEMFERACAIAPQEAEVWNNKGNALLTLGRSEPAAVAFERALRLKPNYLAAHRNLARAQMRRNRPIEAEQLYRRALQLDPAHAPTWSAFGGLLGKVNRLTEAEAAFRRALAIEPDTPDTVRLLGVTLLEQGRFTEGVEFLREALVRWPENLDALSQLLMASCYVSDDPRPALADARRYGKLVTARASAPYTSWAPAAGGHLRVGLVSGDLREHPVGHFLDGMLSMLAAPEIELFAYANDSNEDAMKNRLRRHFSGWRSIGGLADKDAAALVHGDGIKILIDLSGHTLHQRLPVFAWRPAPLQLSWLGYFSTTGVREIDFVIADPAVVPEGTEHEFTERIWRLPRSRMCFTPPDSELEVSQLPALASGRVTFCCFNNLAKVTPQVQALWARILCECPNSVLLLKARQLSDMHLRERLLEGFAGLGVDPARIECAGWSNRSDYLASYARADIALDPFPFTGGTTTVEALWMGVPALTLRGGRMVARQGECLLTLAGIPDWIASTQEEYVAIALRNAERRQELARLRSELRARVLASPIFDAAGLAREFADALRAMWDAVGRRRLDHETLEV